ncbi:MAG: hypothetical protein WD749_06945 [Phycisphaerales bacterium]
MTSPLTLVLSAAVAQLPHSNPPAPLARPPVLERLFLEQPLPLMAGLMVAGIVALVVLNRQGRPAAGTIVVGAAAMVAGAVWLLARVVETPREAMTAAVVALVDATARLDEPGMDRHMAPALRFYSSYGSPGPAVPEAGIDKSALIVLARDKLREYPIREHAVQEVQAVLDGPGVGRTQVRVRVVAEVGPLTFPHTSWWIVRWRREQDGVWRAHSIEPVDIPLAGGRR